jgi:HEAT repeat protein
LALLLAGWILLGQFHAAAAADPKVEGQFLRTWLVDLNSGEPKVRGTARGVLDRIPPEQRAESLIRLVERSGGGLDAVYERHRERLPRRVHYWLLRNFRPHEWITARRTAAAELRGCTEPLTPERVARLLHDADRLVAAHAGLALGQMGSRAVPALREALLEQNPQVREFACNSLAALGKEAIAALPELLTVLEENDAALNHIVMRALSGMGREAVPALGQWIEGENVWRRRQALAVLDGMQPLPPQAAPWVRRAAQDEDPEVTRTAIRLLGRVRPFGVEDERLLRAALNGEDSGLRAAAAIAIGFAGNRAPGLLPDLERRLNDVDPRVSTNARESLLRLAPGGIVRPPQ